MRICIPKKKLLDSKVKSCNSDSGYSNYRGSNSEDSNSGESYSGESNSRNSDSRNSNSRNSNSGKSNSEESNSEESNSGESNSGESNSKKSNARNHNSGEIEIKTHHLAVIECIICKKLPKHDISKPDTYGCLNGHVLCQNCVEVFQKCPECSEEPKLCTPLVDYYFSNPQKTNTDLPNLQKSHTNPLHLQKSNSCLPNLQKSN